MPLSADRSAGFLASHSLLDTIAVRENLAVKIPRRRCVVAAQQGFVGRTILRLELVARPVPVLAIVSGMSGLASAPLLEMVPKSGTVVGVMLTSAVSTVASIETASAAVGAASQRVASSMCGTASIGDAPSMLEASTCGAASLCSAASMMRPRIAVQRRIVGGHPVDWRCIGTIGAAAARRRHDRCCSERNDEACPHPRGMTCGRHSSSHPIAHRCRLTGALGIQTH